MHAVCLKPKRFCSVLLDLHRNENLICFINALLLELKVSLSSFIEKATIVDYDREAELALQRITTGDVDVNQLTNAWTRSYLEVITHFSMLLCLKHQSLVSCLYLRFAYPFV